MLDIRDLHPCHIIRNPSLHEILYPVRGSSTDSIERLNGRLQLKLIGHFPIPDTSLHNKTYFVYNSELTFHILKKKTIRQAWLKFVCEASLILYILNSEGESGDVVS
jgi:hypothetical protein